mmetsp:Transcript_15847/g.49059  ORF Transcript_15847/g.49059 Transcript_15847/m.49059 type:complete len:82 (-) Transcript_15847:715-960(-)
MENRLRHVARAILPSVVGRQIPMVYIRVVLCVFNDSRSNDLLDAVIQLGCRSSKPLASLCQFHAVEESCLSRSVQFVKNRR